MLTVYLLPLSSWGYAHIWEDNLLSLNGCNFSAELRALLSAAAYEDLLPQLFEEPDLPAVPLQGLW